MDKGKLSRVYVYNFVAPYSMDACTRRLRALGVKPDDIWQPEWKPSNGTGKSLYVTIDRLQTNIYHFQVKQYTPSRRYAEFIANGMMRRLEEDQTQISFNVRRGGLNLGCTQLMLAGLGVILFMGCVSSKQPEDTIIWIAILIAVIISFIKIGNSSDQFPEETFVSHITSILEAKDTPTIRDKNYYFQEEQ